MIERSAVRTRQRAHLLEDTRDIADRPVFDDLAVADPVDRDTFGLDSTLICRDRPTKRSPTRVAAAAPAVR
jgi:hypothetical protein